MTVETINTPSGNDVSQKRADARRPGVLASVALLCAFIGLILCWFPVIGVTHAVAGAILGFMSRKDRRDRYALTAIVTGAVAVIASVIFLIVELGSTPLVNTYDASPWI